MFRKISNSCVESSEGFMVEVIDIHQVRYRQGDRIVLVEIEGGRNEKGQVYFEIYPQTLKGWLHPHEYEFITSEQKERILRDIDTALTFLDVRHVIGRE